MFDIETKDYGFEQSDITFLFQTFDEESICIRKNRHWFDTEEGGSDYDISYSILVDGKPFVDFPKEVSRETAETFAYHHFETDKEATSEIQSLFAEMEWEQKMGC